MKITFDTKNKEEVAEVLELLTGIPASVTESILEEPKEEKATPSKPKPKKEPEAPKKAVEKKAVESTVSLAELKEVAKAKVMVAGKDKVKEIISEFAEKLAEVKESDYAELAKKLAV